MSPVALQKNKARLQGKEGRHHQSGPAKAMASPIQLLSKATELLQEGEAQQALENASSALSALRLASGEKSPLTLPALALVSEIQLEMGDTTSAYTSFQTAASIDPDGAIPEDQGGGADKFLYLAQLDESGGAASLAWFEKAVASLERDVSGLEQRIANMKTATTTKTAAAASPDVDVDDLQLEREEKRTKLAHALCGMCELWMTDLSFDDAAETHCENLIIQAVLLEPDDAQTLQTLASIRLSQEKLDDARAALERSLDLWYDLPAGHPSVPEFAARIALARTLMEAGMEGEALEVCERLVGEDDQSIEAWYLGGWCQHLMAQGGGGDDDEVAGKDTAMDEEQRKDGDGVQGLEDRKALLLSSREWLRNCLKLCQMLEYEDDRLRDHAKELVGDLDKELGDAEIEDDDEEWGGIESDEEDGNGGEDAEMDES